MLPSWWLTYKGIEAGLLRSQNPEWFNLYSDKKLLLLICCFLASATGFWLSQKIKVTEKVFRTWRSLAESPRISFVTLALLSFLFFTGQGMSVGEDIGGQVKSSLQWHENIVEHPNFLTQPKWSDLAAEKTEWSPRPPGASWLPLPGLLAGLSLGNSLRVALFLCIVIGGLGWIKFCEKLNLSSDGVLLLAIPIALSTGAASVSYSTANVILFGLVPWFMLWAITIGCLCDDRENPLPWKKLLLHSTSFLILLGCFAWIKLSGIIVAGTIAAYPFLYILLKRKKFSRSIGLATIYIFLGGLFWLPFLSLERINQNFLGFTANNLYAANDSDLQAPLFGKHFEKSTRSGWLAWSILGAPGYALPGKTIGHGFRDVMTQFEQVKNSLDQYKINQHVLLAGLWGIGCTGLLLIAIKSVWALTPPKLLLTYACFFFLPFIGLAILSAKYGFNYLLYHAHTIEYSLIFTVPSLLLLSQSRAFSKISSQLLLGICLALPITVQIEKSLGVPFQDNQFIASATEQARGLEAREFSNAIGIIEEDSQSNSDILLFLPKGDMGDLILRTRLRTLAIHFAGDNLAKYGTCLTSEPATLYCAYSASLKSNKGFQETLKKTFPQATQIRELTQANANDAIAIRITLEPEEKTRTTRVWKSYP
jgi:hypothetical protein